MRIIIPNAVHKKVMHWVNKADFEISGFGKCSYDPEQDAFVVHDAVLLKQEGGGAHTDIDAQSLALAQSRLRSEPGRLAWWWHSHVKMQTFWSQQDLETIRSIGGKGWMVATVFNQLGKHKSAYCGMHQTPFGTVDNCLYEDIDTVIEQIVDQIPAAWDEEFDANVKKAEYTTLFDRRAWDRTEGFENMEPWERDLILKNQSFGTGHDFDPNASILDVSGNDYFVEANLREDAAMLGMTPQSLRRAYETWSDKKLQKLEEKLARLHREKEEKIKNAVATKVKTVGQDGVERQQAPLLTVGGVNV